MAKKQKKGADPLQQALRVFENGDYVEARARLEPLAENSELAEGEREMARGLVEATKVDSGALKVGLAVLGLYGLALTITVFLQP